MSAPSPTSEPRRIPLALRFAAAALVAHDVLQIYAAQAFRSRGAAAGNWGELELRMASWNIFLRALALAVYPLLVAGAYELWRQSGERDRRGAKLAVLAAITASVTSLLLEALHIASPEVQRNQELFSAVWRVCFDARQASWLAFTAGVLWSGWGERPVRRTAALALVCCLAAHPFSPLLEQLTAWLYRKQIFPSYTLGTTLLYLVFTGIALSFYAEPQHAPLDSAPAARRQHRALAALFWLTAISAAATALIYLFDRGPDAHGALNQLLLIGLPAAHLVAITALVAALCRTAASTLSSPRHRLYLAALLYATFAGVRAIQLAHRAIAFPERALEARTLPLVAPALLGIAHLALAWSLGGLAARLGSYVRRERLTSTLYAVAGSQLAACAVLARLHSTSGQAEANPVSYTLIASLCSLAGLLALLRTSAAIVEQASPPVELPAAVLRK